MKIAVLDDYQDAFRGTEAAARLSGHQVVTFHDPAPDISAQADRLRTSEIVVLT